MMSISKKIIPAIIAKNQKDLDEKLSKVKNYVDTVQLDVMDNVFVPNKSLFFDIDLKDANISYEAHLMVQKPESWIKKYSEKVDTILIHYESSYNQNRIIKMLKKNQKRIGFVLNPETPLKKINDFLDDIDQVLIMTVNPGFYGSKFLPEMKEKISQLRAIKNDMDIEVDGGITDKTIQLVNNAGANLFVSGSYIVKSDNIERAIKSLENRIK
jgi:ribulose-phosphate 3-epimerase